MNAWEAAGWGLAGGLCVEALALYSLIRGSHSWHWRRPIPQGLVAYIISVILRAGAGAGLAAAAAGSGQVSGTFAAFALGVAAPLVVEKLSRAIPLNGSLVTEKQEPAADQKSTTKLEKVKRTTADIGRTDNEQ
jgi:hypothetical protein